MTSLKRAVQKETGGVHIKRKT